MVSAAICRGPGTAAFNLSCGAAGNAFAATGGVAAVAAAAPTRPAPLRKLRRLALVELRPLGMRPSQGWRKMRQILSFDQLSPATGGPVKRAPGKAELRGKTATSLASRAAPAPRSLSSSVAALSVRRGGP